VRAAVLATGLGAEKRKRESARPDARGPTAKRENGCWFWAAKRNWWLQLGCERPRVPKRRKASAKNGIWLTPNVRVNRPDAAGWLGPGWENVPRTPDRAKTARRSGSGG
jgi:hypothetical protein